MAFNNWPYTNFQDLNLGWILAKIKEALTGSAAALAKAEAVESEVETYSERISDAENEIDTHDQRITDVETEIGDLETEVGTYSQRISDAEAEANSARDIANTARETATNAQSDATSGIAIGQAAQNSANTALTNANNALSIANGAADSADLAVDSASDAARNAAVALQLANLASDDYLNVGITVYPSNPAQATKNVDEILTAVTANKKINFTLDDTRTGETHTTYDYTIDPVENTANDIDINVIFDVSVSISLNKYIVVTLHKVVSGGNTTYSITSTDVSFSGGGGSGSYSPYTIPVTLRDGVYSTVATGADVFENILDCRIEFNGVNYYPIGAATSGPYGHAYFACIDPTASGKYDVDIFDVNLDGSNACTVTKYDKDIKLLPDTTNASADDFLMLDSNKNPAWVAVPNAANATFGGV